MRKTPLLLGLLFAAAAFSVVVGTGRADLGPVAKLIGPLVGLDTTTMIAADDPIVTDPSANDPVTTDPPHFPKGSKFKLFGSATRAVDPLNAYNEVIATDPEPLPATQQTPDCAPYCNTYGGAYKKFGDHVKVATLTDMLGVKYYFPSRACSGGSPRIQLAIDTNGDGKSDGNAFGYVGHGGFGSGCLTGVWDYVDLTDSVPNRWDLTQFGGGYQNWAGVVAFFNAYPAHRVLNAILVDDSGWDSAAAGCAYYDLVSAGARTLDSWDDTSDGGAQTTSC